MLDQMDMPEFLVYLVKNQLNYESRLEYYNLKYIGAEGMKGDRGDYGLPGRPGPMGETADAEKGDRGVDGKNQISYCGFF